MPRRHLLLLALLLLPVWSALAEDSGTAREGQILHLLDYVSLEYPQFVRGGTVINASEYAEQLEFAREVANMVAALPENPRRAACASEAAKLAELIEAKADGSEVAGLSRALQQELIGAYRIAVAPKQAPDPSSAAELFAERCAACHGASGDGAGALAARLTPAPSNFRDAARQSTRSVFGLFNTITFGVQGTPMRAFGELHADQRWALAFYVSRFAVSDAQRARGAQAWERGEGRAAFASLGALVAMTPAEARKIGGDAEFILAYLRDQPAAVEGAARTPIAFTTATLGRSLEAYRAGERDQAYQLAVTAYLEGFELTEASLDSRDHELRMRTEAALMGYRSAIQAGKPLAQVEADCRAALQLLDQAQKVLAAPSGSPSASFVSSLIIILREGLEAILVLAAMGAFLVRTGKRDSLPWLHLGWVAALALGALTWAISSKLIAISGAHREVTEGVTALVSAALLLYVGFWLHNKASVARWNQFIRGQMDRALSGGALFGIALVSFLAVYREVFETVLFYQALWVQSADGSRAAVMAGFAVGSAGLVFLAWLIARFSVRLPLGPFFVGSSLLLAAMAVVFAGQGVAALQEAGKLAANRIDFPSIPMLGIYPNLQGLALQLVLLTIIVIGFVYMRANRRA